MSPILSLTQEGNKKESSLNDQLDRKSGCQSIAPDSGEVGQAKNGPTLLGLQFALTHFLNLPPANAATRVGPPNATSGTRTIELFEDRSYGLTTDLWDKDLSGSLRRSVVIGL